MGRVWTVLHSASGPDPALENPEGHSFALTGSVRHSPSSHFGKRIPGHCPCRGHDQLALAAGQQRALTG